MSLEQLLQPVRHEHIVDVSLGPLTKAEIIVDERIISDDKIREMEGCVSMCQKVAYRGRLPDGTPVRTRFVETGYSEKKPKLNQHELGIHLVKQYNRFLKLPEKNEAIAVYWFSPKKLPGVFRRERYVYPVLCRRPMEPCSIDEQPPLFVKRNVDEPVPENYADCFNYFLPSQSRLTQFRNAGEKITDESKQMRQKFAQLFKPSPEESVLYSLQSPDEAREYIKQFKQYQGWIELLDQNKDNVKFPDALFPTTQQIEKHMLLIIAADAIVMGQRRWETAYCDGKTALNAFYNTLIQESRPLLANRNKQEPFSYKDAAEAYMLAHNNGLHAVNISTSVKTYPEFGCYGGGERRRKR